MLGAGKGEKEGKRERENWGNFFGKKFPQTLSKNFSLCCYSVAEATE